MSIMLSIYSVYLKPKVGFLQSVNWSVKLRGRCKQFYVEEEYQFIGG